MENIIKILKNIPIPPMYKIHYSIENSKVNNIEDELKKKLIDIKMMQILRRKQKIAITVGSRGIANGPIIVKTLIEELRKYVVSPFVIPAMGSHAGADAQNQKLMLENLGYTEKVLGVPIKSSMEVIKIGTTKSGLPVYIDKYAYESDGIILVNRIKPHTAFKGEIESGLLKMAVIGLGKQKGAEVCHELGFEHMSDRIKEIAHFSLNKLPILFGVGIIENGMHETYEIEVIPKNQIEEKEPELLKKAKYLLARIPFKKLDVLIIDNIGKDISGSGLDTNVVGRYHTGYGSGGPTVTRISILNITDVSNGNGNGLGIADFTTERAYKKFDFAETYPNALTSNVPVSVKIPMVLPNDKTAIQAAIKTCLIWDKKSVRLVRISDTLSVEKMEVSESLKDEVTKNPKLEIIKGPYTLEFNSNGNLF